MTESEIVNNKVRNRTCNMTIKYKCKDCGCEVDTTIGAILALHDAGLRVSERCKECREKKNTRFAQ